MNPTAITEMHYQEIRDLVYRKAGITLGDSRQALVQARLTKRLRALDLEEFTDYIEFLRADESGEEIVQLLDVIATNFTSFFREDRHFQLLSEIVRKAVKDKAKKFRLWCAAASTGEEPYTIAMILREALPNPEDWDIEILATDASSEALGKA